MPSTLKRIKKFLKSGTGSSMGSPGSTRSHITGATSPSIINSPLLIENPLDPERLSHNPLYFENPEVN